MAKFTDKDSFKLIHYKETYDIHAIRLGVTNDHNQYSSCGSVLPVMTNGEVITHWAALDYVSAQPIIRVNLAKLIRDTKPTVGQPILVAMIPDTARTGFGMVPYCWGQFVAPHRIQLYDSARTLDELRPAESFPEGCVMTKLDKIRIYYDWRDALAPIANYFKAIVKYCKLTGKTRRLAAEAENKVFKDLNKDLRTLVTKNNKRFGNIEF